MTGDYHPRAVWRSQAGIEIEHAMGRMGQRSRAAYVVDALWRLVITALAAVVVVVTMSVVQGWADAQIYETRAMGQWLHEERKQCVERGCSLVFDGESGSQSCLCDHDALLRRGPEHRRLPHVDPNVFAPKAGQPIGAVSPRT